MQLLIIRLRGLLWSNGDLHHLIRYLLWLYIEAPVKQLPNFNSTPEITCRFLICFNGPNISQSNRIGPIMFELNTVGLWIKQEFWGRRLHIVALVLIFPSYMLCVKIMISRLIRNEKNHSPFSTNIPRNRGTSCSGLTPCECCGPSSYYNPLSISSTSRRVSYI